jgi:hypothetical protein
MPADRFIVASAGEGDSSPIVGGQTERFLPERLVFDDSEPK